jgi:hypothetical protein
MPSKFTADIDKWVAASQGRLHAVTQQSAQDVIIEATLPQAKGGNLPVDTAFLRNSGLAKIGSIPSGPSSPDQGQGGGSEGQVSAVINRLQPGETLYFGFTANYAQYMEYRYSFVKLAAQNWQQIVARNARKLRSMSR